MKPITESTEQPTAEPPNDGLETNLVEFLDREFAVVPESDVPDAYAKVGPLVYQALEGVRRKKILARLATLPLPDFSKSIGDAAAKLRDEMEKLGKEGDKIADLRRRETELSVDADPNAAAELGRVQQEVRAKETWLANASALKAVEKKLRLALNEAGTQIAPLSRLQTFRQQIFRPIGGWSRSVSHSTLTGMTDPIGRATKLASIADEALAEIQRLERGELPEEPRPTSLIGKPRIAIFQTTFEIH